MSLTELCRHARRLAAALEPVIGQVYFSPECHAAYTKLGFAPSPGVRNGVALPDGPAYFTSRGSLLGHVQPRVVAAAFGVFKPEVVAAAVRHGWSLTDADTIFTARRVGAVAQLERVCGPARSSQPGIDMVSTALARAVEPLRPEGRPLFAGLRDRWDDPTDPWTRLFHLGDMLREYRGDAHVASWTSEGLDAVQIGLLTEAYIGLPLRTYIRTRAWNDDELDSGVKDLEGRGWLRDDTLTDAGRAVREGIEQRTDAQLARALDALGAGLDDVLAPLQEWGAAMRAAGGYIGGPIDLWPARD